jgi:hypothetical protein
MVAKNEGETGQTRFDLPLDGNVLGGRTLDQPGMAQNLKSSASLRRPA